MRRCDFLKVEWAQIELLMAGHVELTPTIWATADRRFYLLISPEGMIFTRGNWNDAATVWAELWAGFCLPPHLISPPPREDRREPR
jgi:hypothetical protein